MKKLLLTLSIVALTTVIMAQNFPMGAAKGSVPAQGRASEFVCLPQSVFSQVAPTYDQAYFCQNGYPYYQTTDDYAADGPFSSLRFWGGDFYACNMAPTEIFAVTVYNGNPSTGGVAIFSANLPGTTLPIGLMSYGDTPLYQIDINLGTTINQANGWIGISRIGTSCSTGFAWISSGSGNAMSYYESWESNTGNMSFCLGSAEPVPVSNWALFIGIGLIIVFTVVRFRRLT